MKMVTTVLAVLAAIVMAVSGIFKLVSASARNDMADVYEIGGNEFPIWFFVLVGVAEVITAIWLLYGPFRDSGGVALFMIMLGAFIFNVFLVKDVVPDGLQDPSSFWIVNVVLGLVGAAIAFLWPRVAPVVANSQGWAYTDGSDGYGGNAPAVQSSREAQLQQDVDLRDMSTRTDASVQASSSRAPAGRNAPGRGDIDPDDLRDMSTR